jgi:hypothetical protein
VSVEAEEAPRCARCHRPVVRNRENYATFEQMHWACFHYEFEHLLNPGSADTGDPDVACADPMCPARAFDPNPIPDWEHERHTRPDRSPPGAAHL